MAQKKKRGLVDRLIMGSEKSEGYARASLPSNRWELFWDILKGRFSKLVIINLLTALFFIPLILLIFLLDQYTAYFGSLSGFSQNLGPGYPAINDMTGIAESISLSVDQQFLLFLPIILIIAAVGIAGGAYVIRNMIWTEGIFVANDFWKGVKQNFFVVMMGLLVFSIIFYVSKLSIGYANLLIAVGEGSEIWLNIGKGMTYVLLGFIFIMLCWVVTMGVTYDLKFTKLVKNSFIFTVALLPMNIFFLFLGLIPFLLTELGGLLEMIAMIIIIIFGFSWFLLIWTDYSQWAFDKFVNDKIPGAQKNRGIYEKVSSTDAEALKKYREQVTQASLGRSTLTRRPIKPITDDELQLVELPQSYGRADLQKLQESKEAIYRDTEEYVKEHKDEPQYQLTEEEKKFEEEREARKEAARLALEGKKPPKQKKKK